MSTARFQVSPPLSAGARTRRQLTTQALAHLEAQGYAEIEVPLLAPYEELQSALGPEVSAQLFRFIDRDGTMLVLRGDLTPVVARQLAPVAEAHPGPLRVAYADRVARVRRAFAREQVEANELGVELIGEGGAEAELEITHLAVELLAELGVSDLELAVGDVRIAGGLVEAARLPAAERRALERAITRRDPYAVSEVSARAGVPEALTSSLRAACALTPGREDLARFEQGTPAETRAGVAALQAGLAALEARGVPATIAPDLGALDDRGYYTGARFSIRTPHAETALARGGRYDRLFGHFGAPRPAIGAGFDLDALVALQAERGGEP